MYVYVKNFIKEIIYNVYIRSDGFLVEVDVWGDDENEYYNDRFDVRLFLFFVFKVSFVEYVTFFFNFFVSYMSYFIILVLILLFVKKYLISILLINVDLMSILYIYCI